MIQEKYKKEIKEIIQKHLGDDVEIFIYGSAARKQKYRDIDVGIRSQKKLPDKLHLVKEDLELSRIPYRVDVVNFNSADKKFTDKVLNSELIWLT